MKPASTKRNAATTTAPKAKSRSAHFQGGKVLADHIATAAYYKAKERGFESGGEIQDWLDAEEELRRQTAA